MKNQVRRRKIARALSALMLLSAIQIPLFANQLDRIEYKLNREQQQLAHIADLIENCCPGTITADYVIVGCGSAGSALAAHLSDPDPITGQFTNSVIVIEQGNDESENPLVIGGNNLFNTFPAYYDPSVSKFTQTYSYQFTPLTQTEGVMWGGSSGHNGDQAFRATPSLYNQWAAISGDSRWTYNNLLNNVMIPMETYTPNGTIADPLVRGSNGPLFITQEPPLDNDAFMQAVSIATGAPLISDVNNATFGEVGIGANQDSATPPFADPDSIRSYGGNSFLRGIASEGVPAIVNANGQGLSGRKLQIISGAYANKVIFDENNAAQGVEYFLSDEPDKIIIAKANKEVILCAGALYDPAILQRSGIGDAALLDSLEIPVVFANSNVGQNLQNHTFSSGIIGDVSTTVFPPRIGDGFIGLAPTLSTRQIQLLITPVVAFAPPLVLTLLDITEGIIVIGGVVSPKSRGSVAIVSTDPLRQPEVNFNIYSDGGPSDSGSDANLIVKFYGVLQDIASQAGGTVLYPTPAQYAGGDDALFTAAIESAAYAFHMSGSCSMGTSAANGVVDGEGQVFGVTGLRCASNSIAPKISNCNTCLQAYFIGEEIARAIRGE